MKKKILIAFILGLLSIPSVLLPTLSINRIIYQNNKSVEKDIDNLNDLIIEDINNLKINNSIYSDTSINFFTKTFKELFAMGFRVDQKKWTTKNEYKMINKINIDFNNKIASVDLYNDFNHIFKDPDPYWHDTSIGATWNEKQRMIIPGKVKLEVPITTKSNYWFGDVNSFQLKSPVDNKWMSDNLTLAYPDHNYWFHRITMKNNGFYVRNGIDKEYNVLNITNNSFFDSFININKMNASDNGLVWNERSIKKERSIFEFNNNLNTLKTLNIANDILKELKSFVINNTGINDSWLNNNITKENVELFINEINEYNYTSAFDIKNRYNILMDEKDSKFIHSNNNYCYEINKLTSNLINSKLINNKMVIDYKIANEIYNISLCYFKQNKITANIIINDINTLKIDIWNGNQFLDFFKQIPTILQKNNVLKVEFDNIGIDYISNINSNGIYNESLSLNTESNPSIFNRLSWIMYYRYNALNISIDIINENKYKNGILLNLNKYVSELIGTGNNGNSHSENSFINNDIKNMIIDQLNISLFDEKIFNDLFDLSTIDGNTIMNKFYQKDLELLFNKFNLSFNDNCFEYNPNNYDGYFYGIGIINNWNFKDGTSGDFEFNFKDNLLKEINSFSYNMQEIEPKTRDIKSGWDNNGYFLLKMRTNKVMFDMYDNKYIVSIKNVKELNSDIIKWTNYIDNKDNWITERITYVVDNLFNNKKYTKNKYYLKDAANYSNEDIKEFKANINIDSSLFPSINSKDNLQLFLDLFNNPIWQFIKEKEPLLFNKDSLLPNDNFYNKYEIKNINNFCYVTNINKEYLSINISLFDFIKIYYNKELINIVDKNIVHYSEWAEEITKEENLSVSLIENEINIPFIVIISITLFLLILLLIVIFVPRY